MDLISRQAVRLIESDSDAYPQEWNNDYEVGFTDALNKVLALPSVQPEPCEDVQNILEYLDDVLHPIVSPDNWYVYAELHDMISDLASAQSQNMCEGCKYLPRFCNEEPCVSCSNNYENKWRK